MAAVLLVVVYGSACRVGLHFAEIALMSADGMSREKKYERKLDRLCDEFVQCGMFADKEECISYRMTHLLSEVCIDELLRDDKTECPVFSSQEVYDLCFPPCSGWNYKCSYHDLRTCKGGRERVADCDLLCMQKAGSSRNSSKCGYNKKKGHDICLCR
jgi:hypothetical protein